MRRAMAAVAVAASGLAVALTSGAAWGEEEESAALPLVADGSTTTSTAIEPAPTTAARRTTSTAAAARTTPTLTRSTTQQVVVPKLALAGTPEAPVVSNAGVMAPVAAAALPGQTPDTLNCENFQFQEDAQAELNKDPSDPHRLDQGGQPGVACEALPRKPTSGAGTTTTKAATTTTTKAPSTAMAKTGGSPIGPTLVGVGLILLGTASRGAGRLRRNQNDWACHFGR